MIKGHVTTARGDTLDLDGLIQQATRPVDLKDAKSTRETAKFVPEVVKTSKVRGFVPDVGSNHIVADTKVSVAEPVAKTSKGPSKTMADFTMVKVKETEKTKKARQAVNTVDEHEEDEILGIIDDMES